jgi:hypothetical protein
MVVFLDLEGLGSPLGCQKTQGRLFAVTLLLSSVMIYNNTGPIDLQALQGLGSLAEVAKMIERHLSDSKERIRSPSLLFALRDFALSL